MANMRMHEPRNPEQHRDILAAFGRATALLMETVLNELEPKDRTAVAQAIAQGADLRLGVMLEPWAVMLSVNRPWNPEPLPLATLLIPSEPPEVFSTN